jgi:uncharacterized integral membrane protein
MSDQPTAHDASPADDPARAPAERSAGPDRLGSAAAHRLPATKTSAAFKSLLAGVVVLVLLLVFILENTGSVRISYFGTSGRLPLGVALLLAAVGGALLVGIVGAARIAQLRRHARRRR